MLEEFLGPSEFKNHGQRVVTGQRLMQAASDIFLGWLHVGHSPVDGQPRDFYGRQLKDWKGSAEIDQMDPERMAIYGKLCGWTLAPRACAHRRPDRDRLLPRQRPEVRPRHARVLQRVRSAERARLPAARRSGQIGPDRRANRTMSLSTEARHPSQPDTSRTMAESPGAAQRSGAISMARARFPRSWRPSSRCRVFAMAWSTDRALCGRSTPVSDAALTLVAAPAGYGKTTAVRAWCASLDASVAWVTLDAGDNDPVRLWRYVATAVDRVRSGLGRAALQKLGVAGSPVEAAVDELMNGVAALGSELVVVLDDLHAVTSEECLSSIDYALARLPPNAHVLVVARADPALRLAPLRAAGALVEVRGADLAFTAAEAHELLVVLGRLELGAEEIEVLVERTEGWPAALVLAWLWLRTVEDPAPAVHGFGGTHRFVVEYLSGEVLAALDEDRRTFLEEVAVLGEFTAELCDDVLERTDSASRLAELEHSNLFVSRLERGGWFRIHSLFAEYARAQLALLDPGAPTRIHRRAAEWFRSRGLPAEAVAHAAAAVDHELVAELLVEYHLPLIRGGAGRTLLRWVRTLPDEVIVEHPELAVAAATAAMLVGGRTIEQRRMLQLADRARREEGRSEPVLTSRRRRGWCARSRSTAA